MRSCIASAAKPEDLTYARFRHRLIASHVKVRKWDSSTITTLKTE
jgi:hypothetical protein